MSEMTTKELERVRERIDNGWDTFDDARDLLAYVDTLTTALAEAQQQYEQEHAHRLEDLDDVSQLTDAFAEAQKDSARLDFLRTNGFVGGSCMHPQCFLPERFKSAESFRDAIDAAMAKDDDT